MQPQETFGRGGLNGFLDVDDLVDRIELDEDEIAWRKEFIGFDEADEQRLAALEPLLQANAEAIADDFYENVLHYEQTRAIVDRSPKNVDALKQTQQAYLVSLATGDYDREFFKNRARIGKLHELLDMPLKQYVGQYGVYYDLIMARLNERVQQQVVDAIEEWAAERDTEDDGGLDRFVGALGLGGSAEHESDGLEESLEETVRDAIDDGMMDVLSLLRIINLDMQVAVDTYVDSYAQRLEDSIERRERLAREVETDVEAPIAELHDSSEVVAQRAEAISEQTDSQATGITRAAGELNEMSAAIEEVASVADEVSEESDRTETLAAQGVEAADDALDELAAIEDATDRVADAVDTLANRTEEIDEIVDRLDELAERTTVLAANAKIESSRDDADGSETMGIIASEVRSFAEQTKSDLEAIEDAVEAVRQDAAATVETTEETVARVDTGTDRVRETVDSLEEIHESAQTTAAGMEDVAAATDQQARGVEVTAETLEDLSESADTVASAAESVAAASQQQTASLREVRESVARLTEADADDEPPVYERYD
ncbi:globin-coupled sensor protein [Natrinema altunense]|uniref:Chemotaxis sensory transducer n=1 Tax=Natrinema altunense (strain JCM 12890 / CGMCC 1.3731 / AJ2) TaxID=1227494 RepID=L9ZAR4_NATA2|nr:globin-coupled sensor protein [Natrinema altunense]ELY83555.1 chemotaxis sensory transducer [Natrinema altunense JCM 12890]